MVFVKASISQRLVALATARDSHMLNIRKEQQDEFLKSQQREFHQRILASLRQSLPEQTAGLDDEALLTRIQEAHQTASLYGVKTERGIAQFTTLSILAGPDFHEREAMQRYLQRDELTGDQKMRLLVNMLESQGEKGK
jgi:hypothetical protein